MVEKQFSLSIKAVQINGGIEFKPMDAQLECEGLCLGIHAIIHLNKMRL